MRRIGVIVGAALLALLTACSANGTAGTGTTSAAGTSGRLEVVAAESFWGDLVGQVGGSNVQVTSVLSDPDADPHLFEPGSRAGLAVAAARVVVVNGAGYDDWADKLLAASPSPDRRVVRVSEVLGVTGDDPNPHLWYDVPKLPDVVRAIGAALTAADPARTQAYADGVTSVLARLAPLQQAVEQLRTQHAGAAVAYTERVPGLLLEAAGLTVATPPSFARAVEDGTDPSAADVARMTALLTGRQVKALLYNKQATSPVTQRLQDVATAAGVPVVPVTETPPKGTSFEDWQLAQVTALRAALDR